MSFKREESGDSGIEVSDPLRLTSNTPSAHGPITAAKPALERHISHIPTESDDEEVDDSNRQSGMKKLKNRIAHPHDKSKSKDDTTSSSSDYTEKRHDSGNATTSDFEISPGINLSDHIDSAEVKAKTPSLERHVSSIGEDGLLNPDASPQQQQQQSASLSSSLGAHSPKLERQISDIPQHDYDSDREM